MPMRSVVVAMRTSIKNASKAAASVNIDMMNIPAMNAAISQRRNAFTNNMTTTNAMNSADSVMSVIAALIQRERRAKILSWPCRSWES